MYLPTWEIHRLLSKVLLVWTLLCCVLFRKVLGDGSLYLDTVGFQVVGNLTCHDRLKPNVRQIHMLTVQSKYFCNSKRSVFKDRFSVKPLEEPPNFLGPLRDKKINEKQPLAFRHHCCKYFCMQVFTNLCTCIECLCCWLQANKRNGNIILKSQTCDNLVNLFSKSENLR